MDARMGEKKREIRKKKDTTTAAWRQIERRGGRGEWMRVQYARTRQGGAMDLSPMFATAATHPSSRCDRRPRCQRPTRCRL